MSIRSLAWRYLPDGLLMAYADRAILQLPDRLYLAQRLVPDLLERRPQRVLNIGVHYYTLRLQGAIAEAGVEVFTADPDWRKRRFGVDGRHEVSAAQHVDRCFAHQDFDAVLLNGVLGYGLDTPEQIDLALRAIALLLRPGGVLVIGWDANIINDPLAGDRWRDCYKRDPALLGGVRVGRPNGLIDAIGKPATKYFDALRRN